MIKNIDLLYKIDKANKELKNAHDFILSIKEILTTYTDLKLYDVSFASDDSNKFYDFCDCAFQDFQEMIADETNDNFYNLVHYVGRTSKFYCISDKLYNNIITDNRGNINLSDTIYNLFYDCYYYPNLNFSKNGFIDAVEIFDDIEKYGIDKDDISNELDFIISGEFLQELKAIFKDGIFIYNTIWDFKENQIEYYNNFIAANYEEITV